MELNNLSGRQPMPQKSPLIFTIYKDVKGEYRWRAKRGSKIIANGGEGYKRKESLLKTLNNTIYTIRHTPSLVKFKDTTKKW